jgi:hypothetical protein
MTGHCARQVAAPTNGEYVPGGQGLHTSLPSGLYVPCGHRVAALPAQACPGAHDHSTSHTRPRVGGAPPSITASRSTPVPFPQLEQEARAAASVAAA